MKTLYNIVLDTANGVYSIISLYDYLNGGYLIGLEKRNPFLKSVDSLLSEEEANKKIKLLNQSDI